MMSGSLCAETAVEGNASVYQVYPVSRTTGEGRAEFLRTWRPGFDQEGAGRGEGGGIYMEFLVQQSTPHMFFFFRASLTLGIGTYRNEGLPVGSTSLLWVSRTKKVCGARADVVLWACLWI